MLVLTRRIGETIIIQDLNRILCKLIEVDGLQVKLAFDAPREVLIVRQERYDPNEVRKYGSVAEASNEPDVQQDERFNELQEQMDALNKKLDGMSGLPEQMQRLMDVLLQQVPARAKGPSKKSANAKG